MVVNWSSPEEEHEKTVPKTKIKWLVFFALILSPCTQTEVVEMQTIPHYLQAWTWREKVKIEILN